MKESKEVGTLSTMDVSPGVSLIQPASTSPISTGSAEEPEIHCHSQRNVPADAEPVHLQNAAATQGTCNRVADRGYTLQRIDKILVCFRPVVVSFHVSATYAPDEPARTPQHEGSNGPSKA